MAKKIITGKVVSSSMDKTVIVEIESIVRHPRYGKSMRRRRRFVAHAPETVSVGSNVRIVETKPYSKTKSWAVLEVVK